MERRAVLKPSHTSAPLHTKIIKVLVATISGFYKDQVSIWNHFSWFQPELNSLRTGSVTERGRVSESNLRCGCRLGEVHVPWMFH